MRHRFVCGVLIGLFLFSASGLAQQRVADFPFGAESTTSPDKQFRLEVQACDGKLPDSCDHRLWLLNNRTKRRRVFMEITRDVRVGWAPRGNILFVNDNESSSDSEAYLYFLDKGTRLDLGEVIDGKYPADRRYEQDSHHYVNGVRWIMQDALIVKRFGHFDHPVAGGNEFTVCYVVQTSGAVRRLYQTREEGSPCRTR